MKISAEDLPDFATIKPRGSRPEDANQMFDLFAAPFRGVEGMAHGIYELGDFLSFDLLPDWDKRHLGTSRTMGGSFLEGAVQFALPFGVIGKGLSAAGKAAKGAKLAGKLVKGKKGKFTDLNWKGYTAAGMGADFVAFDGQEERLSNLIQQFPKLQNPVTEFLQANPDDNEAFGRLKNVVEGLFIEAGITTIAAPFMAGIRAIRKRKLELAGGANEEDALMRALAEFTGAEKELASIRPEAPDLMDSGRVQEDVRNEWFRVLDEEADHEDVMSALGEFKPPMRNFLKALAKDDWLGFDHPSQAVNEFLTNPEIYRNFEDLSPGLKSAATKLTNATFRDEMASVGAGGGTTEVDTFNFKKAIADEGAEIARGNKPEMGQLTDLVKHIGIEGDIKTVDDIRKLLQDPANKDKLIKFLQDNPIEVSHNKALKDATGESYYEIKDGNHRYELAELAGIEDVPVSKKSADEIGIKRPEVDETASRAGITDIPPRGSPSVFNKLDEKTEALIRERGGKATATEVLDSLTQNASTPQVRALAGNLKKLLRNAGDKDVKVEISDFSENQASADRIIEEASEFFKKHGIAYTRTSGELGEGPVFNLKKWGEEKYMAKDGKKVSDREIEAFFNDLPDGGIIKQAKGHWRRLQQLREGWTHKGPRTKEGFTTDYAGAAGLYSQRRDVASLFKGGHDENTLVHELLHGFTSRKLDAWVKRAGMGKDIDSRNITLDGIDEVINNAKAPKAIRNLAKAFKTASDHLTSASEKSRYQTASKDIYGQGGLYAFANLDEFLVGAFTNSRLQKILQEILADDKRSVWQAIVDSVKSMLGLRSKADGTLLDEVLRDSATIIASKRPKVKGKNIFGDDLYSIRDPHVEALMDDVVISGTRGGEPSLIHSARGVITKTLPDGSKMEIRTLKAGGSQQELEDLMDAGVEKLREMEMAEPTTSVKDQEAMKYEMVDLMSGDGRLGELSGFGKDFGEGLVDSAVKGSRGDVAELDRIRLRLRVNRSLQINNGQEIIKVADKLSQLSKQGLNDQELEAIFKNLWEYQLQLGSRVSGVASGFGKGLQSTKHQLERIGITEKEMANEKLRAQYIEKTAGYEIGEIVEMVLQAKQGFGDDIINQLLSVNKLVRGTYGAKFGDMAREYYINALVSGPRTWAVNFLGNTITTGLLNFERYIGGWFSANPAVKKAAIYAATQKQAVSEAVRLAFKVWKLDEQLMGNTRWTDKGAERSAGSITGQNFGESLGRLTRQGGNVLENKDAIGTFFDTLGNVTRLPTKILSSTDQFFKALLFRQRATADLWLRAHDRGLTKPDEIANFVQDGLDSLITVGNREFSNGALIKDAHAHADRLGLKGDARGVEIDRYLTEQRQRHADLAQKVGLDDSEELGGLSTIAKDHMEYAETGTFTNELSGTMGKAASFIQDLPLGMGWLFIPFIKTPTNILKFAFERTLAPVTFGVQTAQRGLFPRLTDGKDQFIDALRNPDPMVQAEARGKLATGVLLNISLFTALNNAKDRITGGGPKDHKQKRIWEASGRKAYSIRIGDAWVSYQRLDPLASMIGVYADLGEALDSSNYSEDTSAVEKIVSGLMITTARNLTNKSYLTGLQRLVELVTNPDTKAWKTGLSMAGNLVPNFVGQVKAFGGDQELKEVRSLTDAFLKKIPGMSGSIDARRNILGEPYVAEMFETTPFQVFNTFNPIAFSTKTGDPVLEEMANLHHGFTPPSPRLNGMVDLSAIDVGGGRSAYDRWMALRSEVEIGQRTLRQTLEQLFNSRNYKALDPRSEPGLPSPRIALIRRVLGDYRDRALQQLLEEVPEVDALYRQSSRARSTYRKGAPYEDALEILQQQ